MGREVTRNSAGQFVLAFDLGGTHLRAAVVDQDGNIRFRVKHKTPASTGAECIVRALVKAARECQDSGLTPRQAINAISVVVPGSVDIAAGSVIEAPNLAGLNGFNLSAALTRELALPAVLENDANAAAVGEMWRGAARSKRTIVCLTLGTGVGGGIVLDGKLWHGANDSAGEIGHMCVEPFSDVRCNCGSRGCLELYASATAIVRMAREASVTYTDPGLRIDGITSADIYKAALSGDKPAIEVFRRMGDYLGVALVNLINILNPEMIVIVGGLAAAWDLFAAAMHERIDKRCFPSRALQLEIKRGECGDDAGLLGAARLGFDQASCSYATS